MNVSINQIDKQIDQAIDIRYSKTEESHALAVQIVNDSQKIKYERGIEYGKIIIAITNFILAIDDYVFEFLIDGYDYFKLNKQEKGYLIVLDTLGGYYDNQGDYEKAFFYINEGIEASKSNLYREGEADILSTNGRVLIRIGNYVKAIESFEKCLQIRKELQLQRAQASALNLLGRAHALKGNYDNSEEYYCQSIGIRKELNDIGGITWSYIGIASMYVLRGEEFKSIFYYKKALDYNFYNRDLNLDFQINKGIGEAHLKQKEFKLAKDFILPLVDLAQKIKSKPLLYQAKELLSIYYEGIGDYEKAFKFYKEFVKLKEEVINTATQNRIANKQAEFEIINAKKEAEIFELRNVELKKAFIEIEEKNKEIMDSIKYAFKIQMALIPDESIIEKYINNYFIFYLPKDIVSGDFYWFDEHNGKLVVAAVDCTGHGVPGALMSMLGVTFLTEIVTNIREFNANSILEDLRKRIINSLKQKGIEGENKDGMDISVIIYDPKNMSLQYAGAYNPIYIIRDSKLIEYKADRMPIGIHNRSNEPFVNNKIELNKDDIIYLFSDGFADQFGGEKGKKYKYKPFKKFLCSINKQDMATQKKLLHEELIRWKGNNEQIDDILILGLKY